MAIVPCKECGGKVAGSAPLCPHCGVAAPSGATGKLVIMRSSALTGAMHPVSVLIDGQGVESVQNGETRTYELPAGNRQVEVRGHGGMSRKVTIDLPQGQTITYQMYLYPFTPPVENTGHLALHRISYGE